MAFCEITKEMEAERQRTEQRMETLTNYMRSDMWLTLLKEERESLWNQFRAMKKYRESLIERLPPKVTEQIGENIEWYGKTEKGNRCGSV